MAKPSIVVCTAIYGNCDTLKQPMRVGPCRYVCFTDKEWLSPTWQIIVKPGEGDPTRIAKQYKILTHKYFPDAKYFVWIDGSLQLMEKITPELMEKTLRGSQIAVLPHWRRCIYQEAKKCLQTGKDNPKLINRQMKRYRREGMPNRYGLARGGFFLRRNNLETNAFFDMWWKEISQGSRRDQLSFDYCRWKTGIKVAHLSRRFYQLNTEAHPKKQVELAMVLQPKHSDNTLQKLFSGSILCVSEEENTIEAKQRLLDSTTQEIICLVDAAFDPNKIRLIFSGAFHALRGDVAMVVPCSKSTSSKSRFKVVRDITGNCFFMRRTLFQKLGGLDTNFKIAYAERDLARRIVLCGLRILQCNKSYLPSTRQYNAAEEKLLLEDKALFERKLKIW
jgi:hypothetical protein